MIVDGISAEKVVRPESIEDLIEAVSAEKGSLVPMGGGTQLEFGNPLKSAGCVLDMTGLRRITAYNPADLTIHVEAGATLTALQEALGENHQILPLDPWNGPLATIGGIAAANAQGPLRATGTIRDWIIGMKVVHADGRASKTGGRVVKNVTGYDLAKLYTGSLGTLAVIAEISLKLRARFPRTVTAMAEFDRLEDARIVLASLRTGPLAPICCEYTGPNPAIWIRFGEHGRAVDWQISRLPAAAWKIDEGAAEGAVWEKLRLAYGAMGPIVLRVVGRPADVAEIIETYRPSAWIAHAMNGVVLMAVPDFDTIGWVRERFPAVIEKAPTDVRRKAGAFGIRGMERKLMLDMKHALDPECRLNPGRHVDGE